MTNNSRILVTGADGFIGSHLAETLVQGGYAVKALCQYNSFGSYGHLDRSPAILRDQMDLVLGDIRDPGFVREAMRGCDRVLHLAALIAIPYSYVAPQSYIDTNIRGTVNLLEAARDLGIQKFVHTSTSEVYGTAQYVPIDEAHPLNAQSPYAASKVAADQMALSFQRSFGMPVAVIRPFNTFGPRQSARAVIPTIITQLAAGAIRIKLGNIKATRDFCFVKDTVAGFISVMNTDRTIGEVTNVGSNFEISIEDTAKTIGGLMGVDLEIEVDAERLRPEASEVERLFAATDKAKRLTTWTPEFAGLDGFKRGLGQTIDWFRNPENLARYDTKRYQI
jgi:dTDP-glucose 4,6-dehydratase